MKFPPSGWRLAYPWSAAVKKGIIMNFKGKKLIFIIICLVIIAAAVIAAVVLNSGKKVYITAEELPCECYYKIDNNGITFYLGKPGSDYTWECSSDNSEFVLTDTTSGDYGIFAVSGKASAVGTVTFVLKKQGFTSYDTVKLSVDIQFGKGGRPSVLGTEIEGVGTVLSGTVGGLEYVFAENLDGTSVLSIENNDLSTVDFWEYETDSDIIVISGPNYGDGIISFSFSPAENNGDTGSETDEKDSAEHSENAVVCSAELGAQLKLTLLYNEGVITPVSVSAEVYEPPQVVDEEQKKEFENVYGEVKLPGGIDRTEYATKTGYYDINGATEEYSYAAISFYSGNLKFKYKFTDKISYEDCFVQGLIDTENPSVTTETVNGAEVKYYLIDEKYIYATWKKSGTVYCLLAKTAERDTVGKLVKEIA